MSIIRNKEELEEAMIKLGKDEELRLSLGRNGREFIAQNFSYNAVADKFYNFFQSII